ncbi:MAG: potassium-transporting ATPase subunit C [Clostridia bacterium]
MKNKIEELKNIDEIQSVKPKKRRFTGFRAAIVSILALTLICGIIYPLSVTMVSQTLFPYEANGSVIEVTLKDGSKRVYGSELIGQEFTDGKYLLGRINLGAPSNLAPNSDKFKELVKTRKEYLNSLGHNDDVPTELVTSSGSGVDPHISVETAKYQVNRIVSYRNKTLENTSKITDKDVEKIIDKYTKGRFLGVFGEKTVNVLLVNLALDGLL